MNEQSDSSRCSLVFSYGDGYGNGYGYGYGYGYVVGRVGDYEVRLTKPFGVVTIGCQARTVADWATNWQQIARAHDLSIEVADVNDLLLVIESA